jgi:Uma2 family endonuclease
MNAPVTVSIMTTDELLAMPEDGVERELIRGQLWEKPMTRRNRPHSKVTITLGTFLHNWLMQQPKPRGEVLGGEAGFRIRRNPDSTVGIDVAYISAELAASTPPMARLVDGPPVLAVEILSPRDEYEQVTEKVKEYLDAGVALVWVVDPAFRTVQVYRREASPELFNDQQYLSAEPHLPGFRVAVADIFDS